jgi:hypothetical protein
VTPTDWQAWHAPYADPTSSLSRRRRVVQGHVRAFLDERGDRPTRVVSLCAGDGRDLLEVLAQRPAGAAIATTLLEYDEGLAGSARSFAAAAGLGTVDVRCADAGWTDAYRGAVPADLVLACGVFGNVSVGDVHATVTALPQLCAEGALVVWTRGRRGGDPTAGIRQWFTDTGFAEVGFTAPDDAEFSVGAHRLAAPPQPLVTGRRLFTFVR